MTLLRRFRACQAGASAVEFAVIGLVMIVVSVGVIEIGRGLYLRNNIAHAADIAGRQILMNGQVSDSELDRTVRNAFAGSDPDALEIQFGTESLNGVEYRTISIAYALDPLIPTVMPETVSLQLSRRIPRV